MVDITNFVNVNLVPHKINLDEGTKPEVLLISAGATPATYIGEYSYTPASGSGDSTIAASGVYTKEDRTNSSAITGALLTYLHIFFANNGVRVKVVASVPTDYRNKDYLENIVIASTADNFNPDDYEEDAEPGIYRKLFLVHQTPTKDDTSWVPDDLNKSNVAIKIGDAGSEMTIAAYLSKMKVYTEGSPVDYDFTAETEVGDQSSYINTNQGKDLVNIHYNFDMQIGDQILNIGGNMSDGSDLVEYYVMIVLQQTVTNAAFKALSGKLYGQAGVAKLKTAIAAELNKYVASKFLVTNQVWTEPNFYKEMGGHKELIVEKNTPISSGYIIHTYVLRNPRKAYIYLLLATAKGIRYVEIKGEYGVGGVQ